MNWREYEKEILYYVAAEKDGGIPDEAKKLIVQEGTKTEFWKLLRAYYCNTLRTTEQQLALVSTNTLDDLVRLAKYNNAHKSALEFFGLVNLLLNPPKLSAVPSSSSRASEKKETPKRVIKKEIQ